MNETAAATIPDDPELPGLRAAAADGLGVVLARAGLEGEGEPSDVVVLKHHPGSRCTLAATLDGRRLVVKAYANDPAPLVRLCRRFAREGLATGRAPTVAPLLASEESLGLLVTGWLDGPTAKDLIASGEGPRAGELAAAWIRVAHETTIELGERYGPDEVLDDAERWVRFLSRHDEKLGTDAAERVRALAGDLPRNGDWRLRHGSFSVNHVYDLGDGPGVIDWDGFRQGVAELDAAMFLAILSRVASGRRRLAAEVERARDAFNAGLAELVDEPTVAWYRAAMLVKLAKYFSNRQPKRWRARAHALLAEADEILAARV